MSSKLQSVVLQAIKTFSSVKAPTRGLSEDGNFKSLISLVNDLQFVDINLPARLFSRSEQVLRSKNPVEYLSVYEDENLVIGVFIIKNGAEIPLHDHPGMHGLLKVLHGDLQVTSYNWLASQSDPETSQPSRELFYTSPVEVTKNETVRVTAQDQCSVLTPTTNNIHEVKCISGPAVFLDILAPPYDDRQSDCVARACHYFREEVTHGQGPIRLVQIPYPRDF